MIRLFFKLLIFVFISIFAFSCKKESTTIGIISISVSPEKISLNVDSISKIIALVSPSNATNKALKWSSTNSAISIVDSLGNIKGVAPGVDTIKVTTVDGKKVAICIVTVNTIPVTGITVFPLIFSLNVDSVYKLTTTISPSNATDKAVKWSSSNSSIAIVNTLGFVKGIAPGIDTIIVESDDGKFTAPCRVEVTKWTTYSNDQISNGVTAIAIDGQGNKWFGTMGGVTEFDGINWTNYNNTLNHYKVSCIAIDSQGNKWFGTIGGGVYVYNGTNWITFNTNNSGLAYNQVNAIAIDSQGNKWFGTLDGVSKFDGTNWITYKMSNSNLVNNFISSIAIDAQGNRWFGTAMGASKFDGTNWTNYNSTNSGLTNNSISSIAIDLQGNIWFGTVNNGVSKFDGIYWISYTTMNNRLMESWINSVIADSKGNIWFGTEGGGVLKFDGINWISYTKDNGLAWNNISSIAIDAQGNKWFGYYSGVSELKDY